MAFDIAEGAGGAASGAAAGTAIAPGIGTAIGAIIGSLAGLSSGGVAHGPGSAHRQAQNQDFYERWSARPVEKVEQGLRNYLASNNNCRSARDPGSCRSLASIFERVIGEKRQGTPVPMGTPSLAPLPLLPSLPAPPGLASAPERPAVAPPDFVWLVAAAAGLYVAMRK